MIARTATLGAVLGATVSTVWGQALTVDMIEQMGNNSLFTRWRPFSHFLAPAGWMNDPCGPLYDPVQGLYHMHYQFHPNHVNWGNISWGHATSPDLVTWTDVDHSPGNGLAAWQDQQAESIGTTNLSSKHNPPLYNHLSIFSGSAQPVNIFGQADGTLLAFYTSVSELPTAWNDPYLPGTESQSLAYSTDGGVTWQQYENNPILSDPPGGWNVTGWRDPFFHPWPQMDSLLNQSEPHYYTVFGSGIKGVGPRMPLYSAPASNLTDWTFLGALWEPVANSSLGSLMETGSYGFNFELSNFFSIGDHYFVSMGAEGGNVTFHQQKWSLWNEGTVSTRANGSIVFNPISGGASDWGILYAITSFNDTKNNRRIQYGWAWEDMDSFAITQQGFQGALSLPRELFVKETPHVIHNTTEKSPGNSQYIMNTDGSWTASTLGVRPVHDVVEGLRKGSHLSRYQCTKVVCDAGQIILPTNLSHSYEFTVNIKRTTGITGVTIAASPDREEYTNIYFDPSNNSIVFDRTHSSLIDMFLNTSYVGYFEPYQIAAKDGDKPVKEPIKMDIFVDGSLVEVFVNDRFALTSRIYPSREDSNGIALFTASGVDVEYLDIEVWDGLLNVWPNRPLNSSSLLVFDTPAETGNYTWWSGD
ncbi:beta-fructofuranosidase [Talaromyces islandicus]|uniref:Beta-fructofuranosidase n=1 Tax=Talaromyces islandicus TaxID=28573 RepID=A0A0U1M7C6_TALIS|nr:beta-fructofuranosidase [Talaromyces islandicus]